MLERLTFFLLCVFSLTGCDAARDSRSFTYRLHNPQENGHISTLHTMPGGALLMVSKRAEQPQHVWNLLRIADWDTSQPREDKLEVDVGPNHELVGWGSGEFQKDRWDRNDQLLMDPGGNYLVVRMTQDEDAWKWNVDESQKLPRAVLNIIDLHGFKLLRRAAIADPLLGAGDMGFTPKGALLVSGLQEKSSATLGGKVVYTRQYALETLSLPDLKPEAVCSYTLVYSPSVFTTQTPSTPEEYKRMEKEMREENNRHQSQEQAGERACDPKLAPLGFSSLDDIPANFTALGRLGQNAHYSQRLPPARGCRFQDLSGDRQYALDDCDESRGEGFVFLTWYRGIQVFRLEDGKPILDLRLPHHPILPEPMLFHVPWFSGVLATRRGVTYAVLLRDGAELESYRLP